jgi:hypothetical protein
LRLVQQLAVPEGANVEHQIPEEMAVSRFRQDKAEANCLRRKILKKTLLVFKRVVEDTVPYHLCKCFDFQDPSIPFLLLFRLTSVLMMVPACRQMPRIEDEPLESDSCIEGDEEEDSVIHYFPCQSPLPCEQLKNQPFLLFE